MPLTPAIWTALAALLSAILLWLAGPSFGPASLGWLAWVALVPLAAAIASDPASSRARWALPLCYGVYLQLLLVPSLPFGVAEGQFGEPPLPVMSGDSPVVFVALVAIPVFAALLWLLGFGRPTGPFRPRAELSVAAFVVAPAGAWAVLDFARANLDPGGMWGPLYLSQAATAPGDLAALAGPWTVTFALVAFNFSLALALVRGRRAPALVSAAAVLAALVAVPALTGGDGIGEGPSELAVAAVQPGYETPDDEPVLRNFRPGAWERGALDLIGDLGELTEQAVEAGAELVVWPEASMYVDPRREPEVEAALAELAQRTGAALIVPFFRPPPERQSGALAVAAGTGGAGGPRLSQAAPKQRPMWFLGEETLDGAAHPVPAGEVDVGVLLGVDTQDARAASRLASRGARLLAAPSHDWRQLSRQHRAAAKVAARSAGLPAVRSDWQYRSAIVGADGRVVADAGGELRRSVVLATVELGSGNTPYSRTGDALPLALIALAGLVFLRRLLASERRAAAT